MNAVIVSIVSRIELICAELSGGDQDDHRLADCARDARTKAAMIPRQPRDDDGRSRCSLSPAELASVAEIRGTAAIASSESVATSG